MNKFTKALATMLVLASYNTSLAHGGSDHDQDHDETPNHEELSVKLPFDPIYNDENGNGDIDDEEMRDNNLRQSEEANELFSMKPIASLGLMKGQLALTIDDGPNPRITPKILDLLDAYNIKATFFVVGSLVPNNASIIRNLVARGHTVGNHTYSHNVKGITSETIVGEVLKAHKVLTSALGQQPSGRLLFRAPGLGWSGLKAVSLNNNSVTRNYIGPIHANLGTDAPRADWSCWSRGISAAACADMYFRDIVNTGRGIVLAHDIVTVGKAPGKGNTLEMLKILLAKLDKAGGIKNKSGVGVWEFVTMQQLTALDQFEVNANHAELGEPVAPGSAGGQ
jgi:peptidoglycan/xylan/chitin deacetylase (PgdA/CDA1 family)